MSNSLKAPFYCHFGLITLSFLAVNLCRHESCLADEIVDHLEVPIGANAGIQFEEQVTQPSRDPEVSDLDLEGLIEFAKKNNGFYRAAQKNIEIAQSELLTAQLLTNPQLNYSQSFLGGTPQSQAGSPEYAPGMSLELDLAGKRGKRKEVAESGISVEKYSFS
ncbi:MAG: hypothetical protein ACO3A2_11120, partial [Bdellovibrionia bacterium]